MCNNKINFSTVYPHVVLLALVLDAVRPLHNADVLLPRLDEPREEDAGEGDEDREGPDHQQDQQDHRAGHLGLQWVDDGAVPLGIGRTVNKKGPRSFFSNICFLALLTDLR